MQHAIGRLSRAARAPELSQSVTERVRLLQNAAVGFRGRLIETLSTACGRLYAKQVTRSATPGWQDLITIVAGLRRRAPVPVPA
jgi:hypothetical protein